ncbi:MAG: hypothetical protein K9H26_04130 [Prolixibacteraceae bacterium]|nr:hypothetical protein [Prolixibacteraceae bacterium]
MKKLITFFAVILIAEFSWGQVPETMSYQAVVRDNSGALMTNHNVGMQLSILQGAFDGTAVYVERQFPTTNENGLITIEIGSDAATVISGAFADIDWPGGPFFIKTEVDVNGGSNYTIESTSQLLSVPYAFHANTADNLTYEITESDPVYTESAAANITSDDVTKLGNLSGVNTGDQDLSGFVTEETDPSFNSSAAAEISEDDIENWNKKSISLNVFGAYLKNEAWFDAGYGITSGIFMPKESSSSFAFNFTLPKDYTSGSTIYLRIIGGASTTGNVCLRPNFISITRPGYGYIQGMYASSGLEIDDTFNFTVASEPVEVMGSITSPVLRVALQAGDVISFGFYRRITDNTDTNHGTFVVHGIEVLY